MRSVGILFRLLGLVSDESDHLCLIASVYFLMYPLIAFTLNKIAIMESEFLERERLTH